MRFFYCFILPFIVLLVEIQSQSIHGDIQLFNGTLSLPNAIEKNDISSPVDSSNQRSFAGVTINTNIFTLFYYKNSQIYVYNTLTNENKYPTDPSRWIFYYIPIMAPVRTSTDTTWAWSIESEVRVNLMLGDREVEEMAREAIAKKFDMKIAEYSKYWDIAPLMIESLTAFVVKGSSSPIAGVQPYHAVHPNSLNMIFRFPCSTSTNAHDVAKMIAAGEYDIEIAFHFDGFKQTSTSLVSITAEQLKSITSKTTADGGNADAKYIHRSQTSKFVGNYVTNVKKMIYSESSSVDTQVLSKGLEDQFISLLQQGMENAQQNIVKAGHFNEVWSSEDLRPDRITSELSKLFTKNSSDTTHHMSSDKYLSVNKEYLKELKASSLKEGGANVSLLGMSFGGNGGSTSSSKNTFYDKLSQINHDKYSQDDVINLLNEHQAEFSWQGEKFVPKSFKVYKTSDLTDSLQIALVAEQITIDKNQGAIIRHVSTMNTPQWVSDDKAAVSPFLVGEVRLYTGVQAPSSSWLLCNGSAVSRTQYKRLFAIIGERYGPGDGKETFHLPDFRGRIPVGVDSDGARVKLAHEIGKSGGRTAYQLTPSHIPAHSHDQGSLYVTPNGAHSHSISDPGHNHGGRTGSARMGDGGWGMTPNGFGNDKRTHDHTINTDYTRITILSAGAHAHEVRGRTGSFGDAESFTVMPPYQTVNYIIYAN